ncbi:GNAT family N-acetyltransferase [Actibacterium pelagium]|uniref:N-acetyltransferase n=1 Tax=Actibacterium pelagium TaxID=2029103 RepID=A0A917AP18_9RHOB|nr:GNAT family N-acetyltransferase [Actibacterium pelagium]GGE60942.1 N-acetyltransferase [Actibacterium pelagium]
MTVERVAALDDQVAAILDRHFALMRSQSPEESCHVMEPGALFDSGADVFVWREEGRVLGIGALKPFAPGHGELKSMHTLSEARGRGIGAAILTRLFEEARAQGLTRLSLETGSFDAFVPARQLYARFGFVECPPFGDYVEDPLSTFMTLSI